MKMKKNGIEIEYKNPDDLAKTNVVYALFFPNKEFYIGSAELLVDRIINHATHVNSKNTLLVRKALKKYGKVVVRAIKTFSSIDEAVHHETKLINLEAKKIWEAMGKPYNKKKAINNIMLNEKFMLP